MTNEDFLNILGELARADMKKTKVLASLTIAQGILESGWGKSELALKANNLFGIKATTGWTGRVYSAETKECYDGATFTTITAMFKAYDSRVGSIEDHSALFVNNNRYAKVVGETDYKVACRAVKDAGYATDPDYPNKLITLIEQYKLYEFDKEVGDMERYRTIEACPSWAQGTLKRMVDKGEIAGDGDSLDLSLDMIRTFVCIEKMLERKEGL